jgi:hypothetical protein
MTFLEASTKILKDNNNQPMSSRDIWEEIEKQSLVQTKGKTPWATLNASMLQSTINETKISSKNNTLLFKIVEKNPYKFILADESVKNDYMDYSWENVLNQLELNERSLEIEKILLYQITSEFLDWKTLSIYNNEDNIEYLLSDCPNYTYIMYDKAHETIKIGMTSNKPDLRLNQLKTANPSIEMIHVFPGTLYSEKELHQKFDDIRKDREWFFNAKSLKNFLSSEMKKHEATIDSYKKRKELDEVESKLFDVL